MTKTKPSASQDGEMRRCVLLTQIGVLWGVEQIQWEACLREEEPSGMDLQICEQSFNQSFKPRASQGHQRSKLQDMEDRRQQMQAGPAIA